MAVPNSPRGVPRPRATTSPSRSPSDLSCSSICRSITSPRCRGRRKACHGRTFPGVTLEQEGWTGGTRWSPRPARTHTDTLMGFPSSPPFVATIAGMSLVAGISPPPRQAEITLCSAEAGLPVIHFPCRSTIASGRKTLLHVREVRRGISDRHGSSRLSGNISTNDSPTRHTGAAATLVGPDPNLAVWLPATTYCRPCADQSGLISWQGGLQATIMAYPRHCAGAEIVCPIAT